MNDKVTDEKKGPTTKQEFRAAYVKERTPQRAHILVVDASSEYLDQLKKRYDSVNLPLEVAKEKPLTKEQRAELESERRDEGFGNRPILHRKGDWVIDERQEKHALKEQNSKRFKARHSDKNPFRHCTFEFMNSNNPNNVLARIKAGEPKIDAVITGLSTYGSKGNPDHYGLAVAKKLAENDFDGVVAISATDSADSYTMKQEVRKTGAIGLFDKDDDSIFTTVREMLQDHSASIA